MSANAAATMERRRLEYDRGRCQRCGTDVSDQFRKTFGTNQDIVFGCTDCLTFADLTEGASADPDYDGGQPGGADA